MNSSSVRGRTRAASGMAASGRAGALSAADGGKSESPAGAAPGRGR
jgi:hypothetical protein